MALKNAGLLANQASIDNHFVHTADRLESLGFKLKAMFAPQHGFLAHTQANMVEVDDSFDSQRQIPIYSLYGKVRRPSKKMLAGIDAMVVDLQDIGTRGYTYVWTMLHTMEACADQGIKVVVIDRPNPINGVDIEGPILQADYFSFVGMHPLPIRHGMTLGELALMLKAEKQLDLELEVKSMPHWQRQYYFEETGYLWVMPSPNIPTPTTALVFPGMELLEGTNLSEGRGTTRPFELFGAPFIDANRLCEQLNAQKLPGVHMRPASFAPTFDKWQGELCHGGQLHITDAGRFQPVRSAIAILHTIIKLHGSDFCFLDPPYEYEEEKQPFDILVGNGSVRAQLLEGTVADTIATSWKAECAEFKKRCRDFLLYS